MRAILLKTILVFWIFSTSLQQTCDEEEGVSCPTLYNCIEGVCVHKPLFPLSTLEIFGSILVVIISGVANAGGLGGGAILTPILIVFFKYKLIECIMIAYVLVFAGSFCNFLMVFRDRQPNGKLVIDYDMAVIVLPLLSMGTIIGVKINKLLPEILSFAVVLSLLIYLLQKVARKAKQLFIKENEAKAAEAHLISLNIRKEVRAECQLYLLHEGDEDSPRRQTKRRRSTAIFTILQEENKDFSWYRNKLLFELLGTLVACNIIKGSDKFPSLVGVSYCGSIYWLIELAMIGMCYYFYRRTTFFVFHNYQRKIEHLVPLDQNKITAEFVQDFSQTSLLAGVLAGIAGIGGGMIISPLLLDYGYETKRATATSGFTVVFTSFISTFLAVISGGIGFYQMIWFLTLAVIGTFIVGRLLSYLVQKYNRQSVTLFALAAVIGLALVIVPSYGISHLIENPGQMLRAGRIC